MDCSNPDACDTIALTSIYLKKGMQTTLYAPCIFIKTSKTGFAIIVVYAMFEILGYIDDILSIYWISDQPDTISFTDY